MNIVDEVILVDDCSSDDTVRVAQELGIHHVIKHEENKGYGGNQKSCYNKALDLGADVVIMLHPDYQYTPKLIESISYMIVNGLYPVVLASRILGNGALKGGMPHYKYFFNRCLTWFQNVMVGQKLSEYHTGYRAMCSKAFLSCATPTTSFSTTRCWRKSSTPTTISARLPARPNISPRLPPSISVAAAATASACCAPRSNSVCRSGIWDGLGFWKELGFRV